MLARIGKNKMKRWFYYSLGAAFLFLIILFFYLFFLKTADTQPEEVFPSYDSSGRLLVMTASFPVFEFARIVGGDQAAVSLILPPSIELHHFVPSEETFKEITKSAIFFYTSDILEPWAEELEITNKVAVANDLANEEGDPHVWLDFSLASQMVENISLVYQEIDPINKKSYQERAAAYQEELRLLDQEFQIGLANCQWRELIIAGHNTFAYLAQRYNLNYHSLQGFIPDDSVDVEKIIFLSETLKKSGQPYVFFEELIMPYLGSLLRQGAGVELLALNAAHNVGRFDTISGITFLSLMRNNLKTLQLGLVCQ